MGGGNHLQYLALQGKESGGWAGRKARREAVKEGWGREKEEKEGRGRGREGGRVKKKEKEKERTRLREKVNERKIKSKIVEKLQGGGGEHKPTD